MNQKYLRDSEQLSCLIHSRRKSENPTEAELALPKAYYDLPLTNHPITYRARKPCRMAIIGETAVRGHIAVTAGGYKSRPRNIIVMRTLDLHHSPGGKTVRFSNPRAVQLPSILPKLEPFERKKSPASTRIWGAADPEIQDSSKNKVLQTKWTIQAVTKIRCAFSSKKNPHNEGRVSQINNLKSCFFSMDRKRNESANKTECSQKVEIDERNFTFMEGSRVMEEGASSSTVVGRYMPTAGRENKEDSQSEENCNQSAFVDPHLRNSQVDTPDFKPNYAISASLDPSHSNGSRTPQIQQPSPRSKREILQLFAIPSALKRRRLQSFLASKRQASLFPLKS